MPDASLLEANRVLFDFGVLGVFCFFLLIALGFAVKQWIDRTRELNAEKDKRLDDVKANLAESAANRQAMEANTTAIRTMLDFVKREA